MQLTHGGIREVYAQLQRAKSTIKNIGAKTEEQAGHVFQAVEISATAFGFAYSNQRYGNGELKVFGLPADISAGIALHAVGLFMPSAGKYAEHIHNFADGALASYAARMGAVAGQNAKTADATGWAPAGSFHQQQATGWAPASAYQPQRA